MNIRITKAPQGGAVKAVDSKSMAHRLLIAGALSKTENEICLLKGSDDIQATLEGITGIIKAGDGPVEVDSRESGATLRFLVPIAAALGANCCFTMKGRLKDRPMGPLLSQLRQHGAVISEDRDELHIEGRLHGGIFELPGNVSSQFITGLLMALPLIDENSELRVFGELGSRPYVDMTLQVLKMSGIEVFEDGPGDFYIPGGQEYRLRGEHRIEGDWSNAAFWIASGAVTGNSDGFTVRGLDPESVQGDKAFIDIVKKMGVHTEWKDDELLVKGSDRLSGIMIDCRDIPDLVPAIAVTALKAKGKTTIMNAERLRLKESNRLHTICEVVRRLGGLCEERPDGLVIFGGDALHGGRVPSFSDHRIVMMAACLRALTPEGPEGDIIIEGAEAVNKSYPGFFDDYKALGGRAEEI